MSEVDRLDTLDLLDTNNTAVNTVETYVGVVICYMGIGRPLHLSVDAAVDDHLFALA